MPAQPIPLPLLESVRIASPCSASWAAMTGDDRTRRCAQCDLDVHNISDMTSADAEAFLRARLGGARVCGRFFRRADGTILTRDCPVGLAQWRKHAVLAGARVAAAALFLCTAAWTLVSRDRGDRLRDKQPFRAITAWLNPAAAPVVQVEMGDICIPVPPGGPTPAPATTPTPSTEAGRP